MCGVSQARRGRARTEQQQHIVEVVGGRDGADDRLVEHRLESCDPGLQSVAVGGHHARVAGGCAHPFDVLLEV